LNTLSQLAGGSRLAELEVIGSLIEAIFGADGLSWKTGHRFRRMLRGGALAADADALKNVGMTDLGGSTFLRLPGNTIGGETP